MRHVSEKKIFAPTSTRSKRTGLDWAVEQKTGEIRPGRKKLMVGWQAH